MPAPLRPETFAKDYLAHVVGGVSMSSIARDQGIAPSTVMRRVRRIEDARDDPEFDRMMDRLEKAFGQ